MCGSIATASAHRYFFGITDLTLNEQSNHLEIVHQFSAHDLENLIAQQKNIKFSPEHPQYEALIADYFAHHFSIQTNNKIVKLNWIGFEFNQDLIVVYQESEYFDADTPVSITNTLLTNTYPKQINTVNYLIKNKYGSLTFNSKTPVTKINLNK
jgi:hypothetical protein